MIGKVILEVRTPRTGEQTPEAMAQFLASLASVQAPSSFLRKNEIPFSLEITLIDRTIHFYLVAPETHRSFIESQLLSQYPKALITKVENDPLREAYKEPNLLDAAELKLKYDYLYPLKNYSEFKEVDPLSSILGMLSRIEEKDFILIQFLVCPAGTSWHGRGRKIVEQKAVKKEEQSDASRIVESYSQEIQTKISHAGFKVGIRIITRSQNKSLVGLIASTFTSFSNTKGNSLVLSRPYFWQNNKFLSSIRDRTVDFIDQKQILNVVELATLFHLPGKLLASIPNISWTKTILSDPPENLPVAINMTEEEKKNVNFFARTEYKNTPTIFGIEKNDRRRHMYIIGKTGTGKSTLIANMAINDIKNREGLAVIDPHGDLSEIILDFIPSYRINDVIYLNPSDVDHPFRLNPFEIEDSATQRDFVASGIVSIFYKLYAHSWGPRLEYILRNTLLTLLEIPNSTLMMVPEILTDFGFRKMIVEGLKDPVLKNFWINEFDKTDDKQRNEATAPILNKVGQFLSSPMIRNIVGSPKSTINLVDAMNNGKIIILNLSQGRVGEDNAALLGAMMITKMQLAAMSRVIVPEEERRDFYLYVDEFQNFATTSFVKILSEARKYRLNLILANQYTEQVLPEVRAAIMGNAGTVISFLIGAADAGILAKEFQESFKEEDLLALGNYQMIVKMAIRGLTSAPFFAQSLPLPQSRTQNREKVIASSRERYAKERSEPTMFRTNIRYPEPKNKQRNGQGPSYRPNPQVVSAQQAQATQQAVDIQPALNIQPKPIQPSQVQSAKPMQPAQTQRPERDDKSRPKSHDRNKYFGRYDPTRDPKYAQSKQTSPVSREAGGEIFKSPSLSSQLDTKAE